MDILFHLKHNFIFIVLKKQTNIYLTKKFYIHDKKEKELIFDCLNKKNKYVNNKQYLQN
jgi:hypothetical protein